MHIPPKQVPLGIFSEDTLHIVLGEGRKHSMLRKHACRSEGYTQVDASKKLTSLVLAC